MKKKFFQINIEKNGPIAGPEMESCPRQCTVCPDAKTTTSLCCLRGCPALGTALTQSLGMIRSYPDQMKVVGN